MVPFANNAIFAGVNLLTMYRTNRPLFSKVMADTFRYYKQSIIRLVKPLHTFKFSEISEAFRMLQARKHGGKVVLQVVDDDKVPVGRTLKEYFLVLSANQNIDNASKACRDPTSP